MLWVQPNLARHCRDDSSLSYVRSLILEPRLGAAAIWKCYLVQIHCHLHGDEKHKGVSWKLTTATHILLTKASPIADAKVKV